MLIYILILKIRQPVKKPVAAWQSKTAGLYIATPKRQSQNYCFCKIANPEALTTAQTLTFDEKPKPQSQAPQYIGASLDRRREQQPLSDPAAAGNLKPLLAFLIGPGQDSQLLSRTTVAAILLVEVRI